MSLPQALQNFISADLLAGANAIFAALGYESDKTEQLSPPTAAGFANAFGHTFSKTALQDEWKNIELLFQLTADELGQPSLLNDGFNRERFESFLFFAVDLKGEKYSRSKLADMAREINKPFPAPVIVLFRYGNKAALASLHRRGWKDGSDKDVLGHVAMLKDIVLEAGKTHRAHRDILLELKEIIRKATSWKSFLDEWNRVLDISELNRRFYSDYKQVFEFVEKRVVGIEGATADETKKRIRDWTQRLFNRLLFLRFLEKKGWLKFEGSQEYLRALWEAPRADNQDFLNDRLHWTFFRGLNTSNEDKSVHTMPALIERRGEVPFLNGGLFDLHDELDVKGTVTFEDENAVFTTILELFEKYVFTVAENTPMEEEVGIDPEMLGKVFEELTNERTESGSYYTPRVVVTFMAREALKGYLGNCAPKSAIKKFVEVGDASAITNPEQVLQALKEVRVCDPACGSGAYLLGVMQELLRLRESLFAAHAVDPLQQYDRKLEIIERNLYGADLTEFAVNIAMLRLWLSLVVDYNGDVKKLPALPNLQYKIGRGDSLTAPNPNDPGKVYHSAYKPLAIELAALHKEWFEESYKRSKGDETRSKAQIKSDIDSKMTEIQRVIGKASDESHDWRLKFAEVFANGGFDIVIANPPYGATVADATRDLYFTRSRGESQSKDTYGLFMARGLQLLKPGGWFTFIVSDTWRTIKSHKPLRRRLLENTSVAHVLDLPSWIFGATVNTGILTFQKKAPNEDNSLITADLRGLNNNDWNGLDEQLRTIAVEGEDHQSLQIARYTYPQSVISSYDNVPFFIASPTLYHLMSEKNFQVLGEVADVKQGLATADNEYYLRKRQGARGSYEILNEDKLLSESEITNLSKEEKIRGVEPEMYGGRHFVPFDKGGASDAEGGWMPNFHVPTEYFIDWSTSSLRDLRTRTIADVKTRKGALSKIKPSDKTSIAAVIRNPHLYFKPGITFSPTGIYAPTFRLGVSAIFGNKGSTIFSTKMSTELLLGFLTTTLSRYLLKNYLSHTVETGEEVLTRLPLPKDKVSFEKIESLVQSIISKQKVDPRYDYWNYEHQQIDKIIFDLYNLNDLQIREVEVWYCRRYPRLAAAQGVLTRVESKYGSSLTRLK